MRLSANQEWSYINEPPINDCSNQSVSLRCTYTGTRTTVSSCTVALRKQRGDWVNSIFTTCDQLTEIPSGPGPTAASGTLRPPSGRGGRSENRPTVWKQTGSANMFCHHWWISSTPALLYPHPPTYCTSCPTQAFVSAPWGSTDPRLWLTKNFLSARPKNTSPPTVHYYYYYYSSLQWYKQNQSET